MTTISPYWVAMKVQTGSWSLSQKASAQIKQGHSFALNKQRTTWSQEVVSVKSPNYKSEYFKGGLGHVLEYSDWYWFWFKQKIYNWKNVYLTIFPIWAVPLTLIGASSFYLVSTLLIGVFVTIFSTPLSDPRYLLWSLSFLLGFYIVGLRRLKVPLLLAFISVFLFPSLSLRTIIRPIQYAQEFTTGLERPEIRFAAAWLNEHSKVTEPKILMRHEAVEFYSDGLTIYTPQELTLNQTLEYAKKNKVNYIIAWIDEVGNDKNLSILLNPDYENPSLNKVFQFPETNPKLITYEVL